MHRAIKEAKEVIITALYGWTTSTNKTALKFFKKMGYEVIGKEGSGKLEAKLVR